MYADDVPAAAQRAARVAEEDIVGDAAGGNVGGSERESGVREELCVRGKGHGGPAVVMVARTLRDVREGEELCIDYLGALSFHMQDEEGGVKDEAKEKRWRREQLLERYGFVTTCSCVGCSA